MICISSRKPEKAKSRKRTSPPPHRRTNKLSPSFCSLRGFCGPAPSGGWADPSFSSPTLSCSTFYNLSLKAPFSGNDGGMALCPQRGGDETHGRATDAGRCAPFYLHFAIHFDSVIETFVLVCLPLRPRHNIPAPTHVHTNVTCRMLSTRRIIS